MRVMSIPQAAGKLFTGFVHLFTPANYKANLKRQTNRNDTYGSLHFDDNPEKYRYLSCD